MRHTSPILASAAVIAALSLPSGAAAAPGDLDTSFAAPHGFTVPPGGLFVSDVLVQDDGRIVVALSGSDALGIARYNANGTLDQTFDANGGTPGTNRLDVALGQTSESAAAVARQADGRYVVAGEANGRFALARFKPDGTVDSSFNDASSTTPAGSVVTTLDLNPPVPFHEIEAVGVDSQQRIVAVGRLLRPTGDQLAVARYLPTGALDTAGFNDASSVTPQGTAVHTLGDLSVQPSALALRPDDSLVVAGSAYQGATGRMLAVGVTAGGALDGAFGDSGSGVKLISAGSAAIDDAAADVVRLDDGRLLLAGGVDVSFPATGNTALARLTPNGQPDPGFGTGGVAVADIAQVDVAQTLARLPDGRIVTGGLSGPTVPEGEMTTARFAPDGTLDTTYGERGSKRSSLVNGVEAAFAMALDSDGRAVVAGQGITGSSSIPLLARFEGDPPIGAVPAEPPAAPVEPSPPAATPSDTVAPVIGRVTLARRSFRVSGRMTALAAAIRGGTRFRFTLSEPATVTITVRRTGRRRAAGKLVRTLGAGPRRVAFTGRLGRRALKTGRYRATLVATDAAGNTSAARRVRFRVVGASKPSGPRRGSTRT